MQRYRRVKLVKGRGGGICTASLGFSSLVSTSGSCSLQSPFSVTVKSCFEFSSGARGTLAAGSPDSLFVQWPVLCHVWEFHPAGACPDPWRSLSTISISIYWQYHWAEFYYKTWPCLTWLRGCKKLMRAASVAQGRVWQHLCSSWGWLLVIGRICSIQGRRHLLTWCNLEFLHSSQVL